MSEPRKKADWLVVAALVLVVVLAPLGLYVGGYFAAGEYFYIPPLQASSIFVWEVAPEGRVRIFRHRWQVVIYSPAAQVESMIRGSNVEIDAVTP